VLRIDETSKTLVAPQAGGLVTGSLPEREELVGLMAASWEAFAHELGMPALRFLAAEPLPGVDILAFDHEAGRAVVVQVTGETVEWQVIRSLHAAADLAAMDAAALASLHEALEAAVPGDSPEIVVIAGAFDPRALATVAWLTRRHGLEISTFSVSLLQFGNERLLTVRREPRDAHVPDPAAEVQWMLTGEAPRADAAIPQAPAGASTPPPGS
jgi:hypothetical protein